MSALSKFLVEKKERKGNTLEARLYHIIKDLIQDNKEASLDPDKITLESTTIWDTVKKELEGEEIPGKPRSYETSEYGMISLTKIIRTLKGRFGANKGRNAKVRTRTFSRSKLDRLSNNYSFIDKIMVEPLITEQTCHAQNDMLPSTEGISEVSEAWWSCNYCSFQADNKAEYDHHSVTKHPNKAGYPDRNRRTN